MHVEIKSLEYLKIRTQKKIGKETVRMSDCEELSKILEQEYKANISAQSLRRFFGLIKYDGGFSNYTLDTIAQFCGFVDYPDFKKNVLHNEMAVLFKESTMESDQDYWNLGATLAKRIGQSPALLVQLHHELLGYPLARQFFLEHHPLRDMAATVYSQYFHEYLKYNDSNEAKLFAYGFLYVGAFLSQNMELAELYFHKIRATPLTPEVYVLPAGRKFGVILLHAHFTGDEVLFQETYTDMLAARLQYRSASEHSVCSFEYTVLEHLILTDRFAEMQFLIDNNTFQKYEDRDFVPPSRKQSHNEVWKIMCCYVYHKIGNYTKAEEYLNSVNLDQVEYSWQRHYTIFYLFVKYNLVAEEEKSAIVAQLQLLINETYFTFFQAKIDRLKQEQTA